MTKLKDYDYDYDSDSEVESKPNAKIMTKLKKTSLWRDLNKNVIIIIGNYYGDYLLLLMIIFLLLMIICYCNKTNCSSIYQEVIRPVLNFLFTIRFHKH